LQIDNKTKHPKKEGGEEKVQDGRTQVLAKKKITNGDKPQREHEKIKYSNPLGARSI